ncbi:MAG: exosortase system-associated protein, TIGR04073 family [Candidatus Omnitrophica bacterium]|nr:exosortase system-associated protein, TIGR04073 family [Candidatus Omnitrophota bacterium]
MPMRKPAIWALALLCLTGFDSTQPATPDQIDAAFQRPPVSSRVEKLSRGAGNVVLGWLELPTALQREWSPRDPATGIVRGIVLGLAKGVARMGVGVYETVTFWLPLPRGFRPILPPPGYFRKASARATVNAPA